MRSIGVATVLSLCLSGGVVLAQDTPDPEPAPVPEDPAPDPAPADPEPDPVPDPDPAPTEPAPEPEKKKSELETMTVELQEEIDDVQRELNRIDSLRFPGLTPEQSQARLDEYDAGIRAVIETFRYGQIDSRLGQRKDVYRLSLREAIRQALNNNPDYLIAYFQALEAQEAIPQAEGLFDPNLNVRASYGVNRAPFFSANPFSGFPLGLNVAQSSTLNVTSSLSKRFLSGTTVTLNYSETRNETENIFALNPNYQPRVELRVVQPLLRGFGYDANRAGIRQAELGALSADANLLQTYIDAVLAIKQAYWNVVRTNASLRAQFRSYESALKFLDDQRKRADYGAAANLDVIIARSGVAQQREGVIGARNALEGARDQLLRLVMPSDDPDKWDILIVPSDLPEIDTDDMNEVELVRLAEENRPDLLQAKLAVETAEQQLLQRENEVLPQLDFFGGLGQQGLGGQHNSAHTAVWNGRFHFFEFGFELALPLFLRSERAAARAARYNLKEFRASLKSLYYTIVLEVRAAIRDVENTKARIATTRASRILDERRLEATRARREAGTAVPRDEQEDIARLAGSRQREIDARIEHRLALARLKRATGTLLDDYLDALPADKRLRVERVLNPTLR